MNKKEAAEFLGVSERTLTNYTAANRLSVSYVKGKTRDVADFDTDDLARLKAEMESGKVEVGNQEIEKFEANNPETGNRNYANQETALTTTSFPLQIRKQGNSETEQQNNIFYVLGSEQIEQLVERIATPAPALEAKLTLTLTEAQALSGVSLRRLRVAVKKGELPARRLGRADRVRPADLRCWLDRQFQE